MPKKHINLSFPLHLPVLALCKMVHGSYVHGYYLNAKAMRDFSESQLSNLASEL